MPAEMIQSNIGFSEDEILREFMDVSSRYFEITNKWASKDTTIFQEYYKSRGITYIQFITEILAISWFRKIHNLDVNHEGLVDKYARINSNWSRQDAERFTADSLRGVYIPFDLEDCFRELDKYFDETERENISKMSEVKFSTNAHFGVGLFLRNKWQLWRGSRLTEYFFELGLSHPDDISSVILLCYHRKLSGLPLDVIQQIDKYRIYWKEAYEARELGMKELYNGWFDKYSIGDTLEFQPNYERFAYYGNRPVPVQSCRGLGIVLDKNNVRRTFLIRLIDDCDQGGIIIGRSDIRNRDGNIKARNVKEYMHTGDEKWLYFLQWQKKN